MNCLSEINLWNRTKQRADDLAAELNQIRSQFKNQSVRINVTDSPANCVKNADIIVTATFSNTPILNRSMIKNDVHINGKKTIIVRHMFI